MEIKGWKYYNHAAVPTCAPHERPNLQPVITGDIWEQGSLNRGGYVLFIRYVTDYDTKKETSFWYVNKDHFGGMEELSSKMRNQVKKSLKQLKIRRITKQEMLEQGFDVHYAAATSYRPKTTIPTKKEFVKYVNGLSDNHDIWGVYIPDKKKLIAWGVNRVYDDWCDYSSLKAIPEYQRQYYPYYGLIYEMNRYYLEEKKLKYVTDGTRSITEHSNIQPFLIEKFKFRKVYCTLHINYRWWLKIIIRIIYPFRRFFKSQKVVGILNQEAMKRGEM